MPSKTKQDWFDAGREVARISANDPSWPVPAAPKSGTWQRRAYDEGVAAVQAQSTPRSPEKGLREAGVFIDYPALCEQIGHFPEATREHIRELAADYNMEKQGPRRLRLYKKIGQLFERHGLRDPIPTSNI